MRGECTTASQAGSERKVEEEEERRRTEEEEEGSVAQGRDDGVKETRGTGLSTNSSDW